MKNPPRETDAAGGDANRNSLLADPSSIPFRIKRQRQVAFGSKSLEFEVETPLGRIECDLFCPIGRAPFVQPRSVRDKFTGEWRRTTTFSREFSRLVLERLQSEEPTGAGSPPATPETSEALQESEGRFDAELARLQEEARGHAPPLAPPEGEPAAS